MIICIKNFNNLNNINLIILKFLNTYNFIIVTNNESNYTICGNGNFK